MFIFDDVVDDGGEGHGAVGVGAESVGEGGDDVVGGEVVHELFVDDGVE